MKEKRLEDPVYLGACRILETLESYGFQAKMVGGCVRDYLLEIPIHDFDIATSALPEDVVKIFSQKPFKVIPTGLSHGTVTVIFRTAHFEVTTLRIDEKTDGRKAEVLFSESFQEDASRRDFTINAMYQDRHDRIYDYFSGQEDLKKKIVRFVGDPQTRIREDYLRILRYYRFRCRLGFAGVPGVEEVIKKNIAGLANIAMERILSEILKIFSGILSKPIVEEMQYCGVFSQSKLFAARASDFLPKALTNLICSDLGTVQRDSRAVARLTLFCLYHYLGEHGEELSSLWDESKSVRYLNQFKLSKKVSKKIIFFIQGKNLLNKSMDNEVYCLDFVDQCESNGGRHAFLEFYYPLWSMVLEGSQCQARYSLDKILAFETSDQNRRLVPLPVNGKNLIAWTGLQSGKEIGVLMEELKCRFRNREWSSQQEAKDLVKKLIRKVN